MNEPMYSSTPEPQKSNTGVIIGVVVALLLCCCCIIALGGLWVFGDSLLGIQ